MFLGFRRVHTAFAGALLGLICVWLLEATRTTSVPALERIARPPATRLVVLFVDSLNDRDVLDAGAMPKLAARLARGGLHGPVQPCADEITVPCVAATISGNDRLSVFALGKNFASNGGAIEQSVLGQLQREGHRAGYLGEHMLAKPMRGLARVVADLENDEQLMHELSAELRRDDLQLVIAHFRAIDQTAHDHGEESPEYTAARLHVDDQVDDVIARLRPSDHVVVMGDHGHTTTGRHAAGLSTTTYAAYFGPQFGRALRTPMRITEHAAIWARIFGFERATPAWVDDYFAGRPLRSREATDATEGDPLPTWALLACAILAFGASVPASTVVRLGSRERLAWLARYGTSAAAMASLGIAWPAFRTFIWHSGFRITATTVGCTAATGLLGVPLAGWLAPPPHGDGEAWDERFARFLSASVVFAIPTVYWQGGLTVAQAWLVAGLLGFAFWFAKAGRRDQAALAAIAALVALSVLPVKYANYVMRGYPVYTRHLPGLSEHAPSVVAAVLLFAALVSGGLLVVRRPSGWIATALGVLAAACVGRVPDVWFAVPCALALPLVLVAVRRAELAPVSVAFVLPAVWFAYDGSLAALSPIFAVWLLCALLPRLVRESVPSVRGVLLLTLVAMGFRAGMSCRISGVDFDFFFRFLPEGTDVTAYWHVQAILTTFKYLLPPMFGVLIARAGDPDLASSLRSAAIVGRARIGMCLFFVAALIVANAGASATIIGDATQEAAFWVLALATLGCLSLACPARVEA